MSLNEAEIRICKLVVHRLLEHQQATPRNDLLKVFKGSLSTPLDRLIRWSVLRRNNPGAELEEYLPEALAFHYCGDANALSIARKSTETVLHAIRTLFDQQLETNRTDLYTPDDVLSEARKVDTTIEPKAVWLGLYFAAQLSAFSTYQPDETRLGLARFRPREYIYQITDSGKIWDKLIQEGIKFIERNPAPERGGIVLETSESDADEFSTMDELSQQPKRPTSRKVFLVHGRDERALQEVSEFLKSLGLEVVILYQQPNRGQTIIEKFEKNSDVGFAVVLLTPDDIGAPISEPKKRTKRARQNVILELGYFIAKLGRQRVCPLQVGEVELPSDIHGVVYVPYDTDGDWRQRITKEIESAGIKVH